MTSVPPIRREVVVDLAPRQAFELFTGRIGDWWPVAELSVFGEGASVAFVDRKIVESLKDQTSVWGSVTEWEPGERVSFSWHPGQPPERASSVTVSFRPAERERTLVVLEHFGWEVFEDPPAARAEYDQGWPRVLGLYRDAAARASTHRPTPGWPSCTVRVPRHLPRDRSSRTRGSPTTRSSSPGCTSRDPRGRRTDAR